MAAAMISVLVIILFLNSCGRQDKRNYSCTVEGEDCTRREPVRGPEGPAGPAGPPGPGCTVFPTDNGAVIACSDGTAVTIENGTPGPQGPVGTTVVVHKPKGNK